MASFSSSILFMSTLLFLVGVVSAQLSSNFYGSSCPAALSTIQGAGCDASVLLDDTPSFKGEKTAGPNAESVRGFEVIDSIKSTLESKCPGVVSCADILAVAARDSVVAIITSGSQSQATEGCCWVQWMEHAIGKKNATTASSDAAESDLPSPFSDLSTLISAFANKGFTAKEMVVLSGAHTIGQARCLTFRTRLYEETNLDSAFASSLKQNCPRTGGDNNLSPLDETAGVFDNTYFKNLVDKKGLFHSDQQLFNGGSTNSQVTTYSLSSAKFFTDFGSAMIKMGNLSPLTGSKGEIRTNCRKTNGS
ncbi:Cationic peroxidase 1 [Morella rubra]|uniref:Peroxidase n=1 Tax=Morella rubra TaxID=262757 RepID=A0A6A1W7Z8_9ROSI|nr:Cationic peroxidase 1 [Morella rubra]